MEFWLFNIPSIHDIGEIARRTEAQGFDGMTLTDSQNLTPDTYVSLTLAAQATTRLKLGPGVTNPVTRHPAVAAAATRKESAQPSAPGPAPRLRAPRRAQPAASPERGFGGARADRRGTRGPAAVGRAARGPRAHALVPVRRSS